jgi:hypothetical protein
MCRFLEHVRQIRIGRDTAAGRSRLAMTMGRLYGLSFET